ncbi:isotrichodermin C-15 hydroxylase [Endocarpon pusillum]|uniref:Isotrichodermin C-15 hydroxylase n=1 Tax=Endocarpon pusillum TaxID=364733 RepID=A0A8H7E169_9EURO|nr:isotrichodermin C-15 hydroxylase [Endocarpon pusillum]
MIGVGAVFGVVVGIYLLSGSVRGLWNVFFHPLGYLPGPKSWIAFPILRQLASTRGVFDARMREFHRRYGDIVRFGPNEVSFINAQAWKDIYGQRPTQQLQRFIVPAARHPADIFNANEADHARFRKALLPAFSQKGLQEQEPILGSYVGQLVDRLKEVAVSGAPTDMVEWYNWTTFDMIGDLAFGEPFGGLNDKRYHFLIPLLFESYRMLAFLEAAASYPLLVKLLLTVMPTRVKEAKKHQMEHAEATVRKRLNNGSLHGRGDFMDAMLRNRGGKEGLTDPELVGNAAILMVAGSETTATVLSGLTFWLLRTPAALKRVTMEVRTAFESEADIVFSSATARLPYMLACINEALRLYPPVPTGLQRLTPSTGPVRICGHEIPANTKVSVHQSAAYTSPANFHCPDLYVPERWLPEVKDDPSSPFYNDCRDVVQPFSVGPRDCIGRNLAYNEMRIIFARLLWNFDLELCQESERWNHQRTYFLWEKPALMCKLRNRHGRE